MESDLSNIIAPFHLESGYVVVDVPGLGGLLIDTGAGPCVTSDGRDFELLGARYPTAANFNSVTLQELQQHIGLFDVLLGQEVLRQLYVYLNVEQGNATLSRHPISLAGPLHVIPLLDGTVPQVDARVGAADVKLLLDTGAPNAFIDREHLNGFPKIDEVEDFHPTYGKFRAPTYAIPLTLGEISIPEHRFSVLPEDLALHTACGANGILGLSHLMQQGNVLLALPDKRLVIKRQPVGKGADCHARADQ